MVMEWWQFALTTIVSLTTGGVIQWFLTAKYQKKKVKSESDMVAQQVTNAQIESAQKLVKMYEAGMEQIQKMSEDREKLLNKKIEDFEATINALKLSDQRKSDIIETQSRQIKGLERLVANLKLELEAVRRNSEENCEHCLFKEDCKKYLAKQDGSN